jgi:hypothetical protein
MVSAVRAALAVLALNALVLAGCFGPTSTLEAYLRAAAGAEAERGWQYVAAGAYDGDKAAYIRDAQAADWSSLRWSNARLLHETDGSFAAQVTLDSSAASVPDFLIARHILAGVCRDGAPVGLGAWYSSEDGQLAATKVVPAQSDCNAAFIGDAAYEN